MKANIQKETALKGLLLLALLANISWQPALETLNLTQQSSSGAPSGETLGGSGGGSKTQPATQPATQPTAADTNEQPETLPPENEPQDTSGTKATGEGRMKQGISNICGVNVYITFTEINVDGKPFTAINIRPHSGGSFRPIDKRIPGNFALNLDKPDIKKFLDNDNAAMVRNRLGNRCVFETENTVRIENNNIPEQSERDRDRLKKDMNECRVNSSGKPLPEFDVLECKLRRLSNIDVDTDRRGGELRAMVQLEKLVKELRPHLKRRVISRDEEEIRDGEEKIDEIVDILKERAVDLNLSPARIAKIISILESLKTGGETYRRSIEFDEKVKGVKEEARGELLDIESRLAANPRDPIALNDRMMMRVKLNSTYDQLLREASAYVNPSYNALLSAQRMGLMPMSEFSQFAQPYQLLGRDLNTLTNPQFIINDGPGGVFNPSIGAMGTTYGQPLAYTDFNAYRSNLAGNRFNAIGSNLMAPPSIYPQVPYQMNNGANNMFTGQGVFNSMNGAPSNVHTDPRVANMYRQNRYAPNAVAPRGLAPGMTYQPNPVMFRGQGNIPAAQIAPMAPVGQRF